MEEQIEGMKKYILFAYNAYYPSGGLDDIEAEFDSLDQAVVFAKNMGACDCKYIIDRDTWEIVWNYD